MRLRNNPGRWQLLLLVVSTLWWGCAGTTQSSAPAQRPQAQSRKPIKEEFDPNFLQEDLLLIQPVFPRPALVEQSIPVERPARAEQDRRSPVEDAASPPLAPEPAPVTGPVYRVQIMALSNEQVARQRGAELEAMLGVPVYVERQRHLFLVRAGDYQAREDAEILKKRLSTLHSDYRDAYVVSLELAFETWDRTPATVEQEPEVAPPVLVPAFGWRVLLDQFLTHTEANQLKGQAMRRLNRRDIDVIFKAPWYKVEVGNFRTEAEAQVWVEKIKNKRYRNALKIRAQILVPQE